MQSLGHYRIVSPLGAGGMGEVYLATDTLLNRNVAIKVLPASTNADEEAQRRMLREARMVATIDHPNVCTIYEIGADGGRPYIVMQYIEGETLSERMRRARLTLQETIDIAKQITSALTEAHNRGIVHRDIKPGNIMITSAGLVKVLDFGLAKSFAAEASVTEMMVSREGMVAGTTAYMSPEQLRAQPLDGRSDIFSLGIMLYEIASGARPFDRPTVAATITAILTEEPPPLDSPLQPVIARALAKSLSRRFPSAAALQEALIAVGKGRKRTASRKHEKAIAILPFVSESADESFRYVEEGLLDRIIASLGHVSKLKVIRGAPPPPAAHAAEGRGAPSAVINGKIKVSESSLELKLEMKDARNATLWQRTFQKSGRDIEGLAAEVAAQIAGSKKRRKKKETAVDPATEKLYLRGRFHWNKRHPEAIRQAIASFQEAVERDPMYANAYAGLADAYLMLGFLQALPPRDVVPKAKAAALRAIDLDASLAEPHASLGYMAGLFDWDWNTARRELTQAMDLNPNYPWAPHWYGLLAATRSLDESMEHLSRARDLDPLSPIINTALGIPLHLHRRYHEAVKIYSQVLESEAGFAPAYYYIGMSYEQLGDFDAAMTNLGRAADIAGRGALFVGALGHCLGASGRGQEARTLLAELEQRSTDRYVSPYNAMLIHLGLGQIDEGLKWLERALEERTGWLWMTPVEPRFDRLRGNPAFQQMVGRYGLRSEE